MFVQNFKHLGSFAYVLTQTIKSNSRYARLATASLHFFFPRPIHDGLYDLLTMRPSCEGMTREYTLQLKPHSADSRSLREFLNPRCDPILDSVPLRCGLPYPKTADGQNHLNKTVDARGQRLTEANNQWHTSHFKPDAKGR